MTWMYNMKLFASICMDSGFLELTWLDFLAIDSRIDCLFGHLCLEFEIQKRYECHLFLYSKIGAFEPDFKRIPDALIFVFLVPTSYHEAWIPVSKHTKTLLGFRNPPKSELFILEAKQTTLH